VPFRRRTLGAAAIVVGVLLELSVAAALSEPRLQRLVPLLVAGVGLALVFAFPLASAMGLLVISASIFHGSFFTWSVGPLDVHLEEVVFGSLALVAVIAPRRRTWGGMAGVGLGAFLAIVCLCGWLGVQAGRVTLSDAFNWARPLMFYATFWIVLRLFPDPASMRRLLVGGLACGAITGCLAVALQLAPSLIDTFQGAGGQQIYTQATQAGLGDFRRIRQPGLALSYVLFWWALVAAMTARGARRALLWALVTASSLNLLLSFNRNMWLGLFFGLALMLALSGRRVRHRLLGGIALAAAVVLMLTVVGNTGRAAQLEPIVARAATVLTPQQIGEESSLRARKQETAQAWRNVRARPLTGVGIGADFGVRFNHDQGNGTWVPAVQRFLHDQWVWLLLIGGVPGLMAFVTFVGTVLHRAWAPHSRTPSGAALGTGVATVMLSALVMPYLGVEEFCLAVGVVAGVIVGGHEIAKEMVN
jgi:hypothetical protein